MNRAYPRYTSEDVLKISDANSNNNNNEQQRMRIGSLSGRDLSPKCFLKRDLKLLWVCETSAWWQFWLSALLSLHLAHPTIITVFSLMSSSAFIFHPSLLHVFCLLPACLPVFSFSPWYFLSFIPQCFSHFTYRLLVSVSFLILSSFQILLTVLNQFKYLYMKHLIKEEGEWFTTLMNLLNWTSYLLCKLQSAKNKSKLNKHIVW